MIAALLIGFVVLLGVGAPIVVAMGLPAAFYFIATGTTLSTITYSFYQSLYSFNMLAVTMFLLMGNLVTEFGETERAFRFARTVSKGKKGYSSKIAVILNLIFAGMSGASISAVCGLGPMMVEEMDGEGYDRGYASQPVQLVRYSRPVSLWFCTPPLPVYPARSPCCPGSFLV